MTDDEILIYAYLDDQLSADELQSVEQRLIDDPSFARALVEASRQQMLMGRQLKEDSLRDLLTDAATSPVIKHDFSHRKIYLRFAGVALLVCGIVLLLTKIITDPQDRALQWTQAGLTEIITEEQYINEGFPIFSKEPSQLSFPDKTMISIGAQTNCLIKRADLKWMVSLESGSVRCVVAPQQAGHQFKVTTQDLAISVIGTAFRVESGSESEAGSRVFVEEGSVAVQDKHGKQFLLTANDFIVHNESKGTQKRRLLWSADIDNGRLPASCNSGRVKNDPQHGFVFEAEGQGKQEFESSSKGVGFQSLTEPLFVYENDLIFECEYRLNKPARWIGLWVRGENMATSHYMSTSSVYDTWHTLRLDLNDIESKVKGQANLQVDEAIRRLVVMTGDDAKASLEIRGLRVYRSQNP